VVERGSKDGYSTAVVEFLSDQIPTGTQLEGMTVPRYLYSKIFSNSDTIQR
jgi:hypothetical protein